MSSPEQFYQPQPGEVAKIEQGGLTGEPTTSPRMEQAVATLAAAYGVDLAQVGATLNIDQPEHAHRWLITNLDGARIGITRCRVDEENCLAPDLDMVFAITSQGWEPVEIIHADPPWDEFTQAAQAQALTVFDPQGNLRYDVFTEFWAHAFEQHSITRV